MEKEKEKEAKKQKRARKAEAAEKVNDIYRKVNEIQTKTERALAEIANICSTKGHEE